MSSASQYTDALHVIKSSGFLPMTHHKEAVTDTALTAVQEWMVMTMRPIDADALRKDLVETLRLCEQWMADAKDDETKVVSQANWFAFLEAKLRLDSAPTIDAVPVVRCKDCVYRVIMRDPLRKPMDCYGCKVMHYNEDDWFCSFGERKDDE